MPHARRLLTRVATCVATATALVALPATAGAVPSAAVITPTKVPAGTTAIATGTVAPVEAGVQVQLEQLVGDAWTPLGAVATTNAAGAWKVTFLPKRGGPVRATQLTGAVGSSAETTDVALLPKVSKGRVARGALLPFAGAKATWRILPRTYPVGTKIAIKMSIGGRATTTVNTRVRAGGLVQAKLPTNGVGRFVATLALPTAPGWAATEGGSVAFAVRGARVGPGSSTAWNQALRAGLRFRGFYVPSGSRFDGRMGDAVIAFHKAYRRPRTTTFEASDWNRLTQQRVVARDTSAGLHIEIDKGRQILMQVQDGRPVMIIHISSGATGNTPAGRHKIQWKGLYVPSLYGSLLYRSMAFQGAFAIHGYPSVPVTPASHGCVRVPMWIANALYQRTPVNTPVYIYQGPGSTGVSVGRGGAAAATTDVPELTGVDPARWADEVAPGFTG